MMMDTPSLRATQFMKNPKASLYFCDSRFYKGVMLKGKMEVLVAAWPHLCLSLSQGLA